MLIKFLSPYIMACYSAAYALLQTLDGLGIVSTDYIGPNNLGYMHTAWAPDKIAQIICALLLACLVLTLPIIILSAWVFAGKRGLICCVIILLIPGLTSIFGVFPAIPWLPSQYAIQGTGNVGDSLGLRCLVFAGLIYGWAIMILISDIFSTGEKFRQWFDITLILTTITRGIFWVLDKDISTIKAQYAETVRDINTASQYLLMQARDYSDMCLQTGITDKKSCRTICRQWGQDQMYRLYKHS